MESKVNNADKRSLITSGLNYKHIRIVVWQSSWVTSVLKMFPRRAIDDSKHMSDNRKWDLASCIVLQSVIYAVMFFVIENVVIINAVMVSVMVPLSYLWSKFFNAAGTTSLKTPTPSNIWTIIFYTCNYNCNNWWRDIQNKPVSWPLSNISVCLSLIFAGESIRVSLKASL